MPLRLDAQEQQAERIREKFDARVSQAQLPDLVNKQVQTRVRILRLNTFLVAEFDLKALEPSFTPGDRMFHREDIDDGWVFRETEMPHKFLPYSRYVFLDLETMVALGGLDDTRPTLPAFFTNYVYKLSLVDFN